MTGTGLGGPAEGGVGVLGVGKYLPTRVVTNQELEAWTGLAVETIEEKTGIKTRRIVDDGETASAMSAAAAGEAVVRARISPEALAILIACTFTGDYVFPALACKIQALIGAKNAGAFDLLANCTGFQVGLGVVSDRMRCDPSLSYGLVVGTALQSRFINWKDASSAVYFGDGAGAAVLGRVPPGYGILATEVFSNGKVFDSVRMRGGGSSYPMRRANVDHGLQYYEIDGMEVWKQVVQYQPQVIRRSLEKLGLTEKDVDYFIFHQANLRLIEYLMAKMRVPMRKTYTNVVDYGNTADASQAIALCEAVENGCLRRGDLVVISGVGAGFTFGSTVMRWY
jgi:3-oxoacyl-[acyl-carrier-protein] synthase-3